MRRDDFRFVDADDFSHIEHRIDHWIRVVVRFGQRLAHGAPPELARLDSLEIDRRRDALAKNSKQRRVARVRLEIRRHTLRLDKVINVAVDTIDAERSRRGLERHECLTVNSERIEPASKRPPAMDPASRAVQRDARAAIDKLQNRPPPNSEAIDRRARRETRRPRKPQHVIRRQRDNFVAATKSASIADIREWALTIHRSNYTLGAGVTPRDGVDAEGSVKPIGGFHIQLHSSCADAPIPSCDTIVVLAPHTRAGATILAKNSDRAPLECQPLAQVPHRVHRKGATVQSQYLEIPQVAETAAVIGSRPFWLWGFEHGLNEYGVAIGNEAVLTRETLPATGLLGMDLVRLGLERSTTAREATEIIGALIERTGRAGRRSTTLISATAAVLSSPIMRKRTCSKAQAANG